MKPCNDYPVTFAYKAQDGKYYGPSGSVGPYHRGEDRACPAGSPIIVQGTTIGLVGATGLASGPHLHFQCMRGSSDVSPVPYRWASGRVTTAGWHSQFGNQIRITHADGTVMIYAHLSKINVSVGQILSPTGGNMAGIPDADNYFGRYNKLMLQVRGRNMTRDEFRKNIVGVSDLTAVERISDNVESDRATEAQQWALANRATVEKRIVDLQKAVEDMSGKLSQANTQLTKQTEVVNQKQAEISSLQDQVADLTKENAELKAQLATCGKGDDTEWLNKFGELLRWIIIRLGLK